MSLNKDPVYISKCFEKTIPLYFSSDFSEHTFIINRTGNVYIVTKQLRESGMFTYISDMYIENKDDLLEFLECYIDIQNEVNDVEVTYAVGYDNLMIIRGYTASVKRHLIMLVNMIGKLYKVD